MKTNDPISTPMVERTIRALDSANPFMTPTRPPMKLDGTRVKQEVIPSAPLQAPQMPQESAPPAAEKIPPTKDKRDSLANLEEPEAMPDDVAEFLSQQAAQEEGSPAPITEEQAQESFDNPIIESRDANGMPNYRCEFGGRDIFVAWAWYKTTNPVTAATQVAYALDFGKDKIRFDMSIGDAIISHSRNRLAHKFLETDAKWMLMIDDDIIPSIGRPLWFRYWVQGARKLEDAPLQRHGIHRLIGAGKTLVGGAYFGRQEGGTIMCSDRSLYERAKAYEDKVVPVDWVGTGFILIHRKIFNDIREKFGDSLKIDVPDYEYDYFRHIDGANGEDVSFCKRAKAAGHQPHIDLGLPIFHVGAKTY